VEDATLRRSRCQDLRERLEKLSVCRLAGELVASDDDDAGSTSASAASCARGRRPSTRTGRACRSTFSGETER
jgi:hypothetical protein